MKIVIATVILSGIAISGIAMADCPTNLSAEETVECVVIEGATNLDYLDEEEEMFTSNESTKEMSERQIIGLKE